MIKTNISIKIKIYDTKIISLKGNPTTGYVWTIAATNIECIKQEYIANSAKYGSDGMHNFSFRANQEGNAKIIFSYKRAWDKNVEPIEQIIYDIEVN